MKYYTLQLERLDLLVDEFVETFRSGVIILKGDLAAGKTTLVKRIVAKLGIEDDVTSPTFSLQQSYGKNIYHYDMYNHGLEHFLSLGMLEELEKDGLHFVEWGSDALVEILTAAGIDVVTIEIKKISNSQREYSICTH